MKTIILTTLVVCASVLAKAQQVKLHISVANVAPGKGNVVLNIYDKKTDFLKKSFISKIEKADNATLTFIVDLPQKGTYAVTVFQDLDDNKKLKQDWFGIPQEPVGYGNNFQPTAKPTFSECAIVVDKEQVTQTIKLY
ncbi:DUF2141 domain-containing protein [Chitinophaga nivalis]|uniref:DUF2141 domain-containing protein n=1 Tax=Chitinophaga nivalis TaxID=2991709 RepID=A0ABT3IJI5_9BACT|nr:DUF2141 domain-containing protein [Chitinophaga nivalis]MCW3466179.1 DUF2141 domain-containing protein [Chitinophaga nivalis]MCW3484130.1 DUF2141 domain-containing protein [Chitinophaga nivalis]